MAETVNDNFIRNRRNLIIMSFVVIVYGVGKLEFSEIVLGGAKFTVGKPEWIPMVMFMLLLYFFFRYCGVCMDVGVKEVLVTKVDGYLEGEMNKLAIIKAIKESNKEVKNYKFSKENFKPHSTDEHGNGCYPIKNWSRWYFLVVQFCDESSFDPCMLNIEIKGFDLFFQRIKSFFYYFIINLFLEYLFPFVIFGIAVYML